jgi:hypothetical protein
MYSDPPGAGGTGVGGFGDTAVSGGSGVISGVTAGTGVEGGGGVGVDTGEGCGGVDTEVGVGAGAGAEVGAGGVKLVEISEAAEVALEVAGIGEMVSVTSTGLVI